MEANTPEPNVTEQEMGTAEAGETSTGLDENVLGALSYLFGIISGLLVYLLEDENEFAHYHAAQSIVLSVAVIAAFVGMSVVGAVFSIVLDGVPLIGALIGLGMTLLWLAVWLGSIGVWLYVIVTAFQGKRTRLPIVSGLAESYLL